MSQKTMWRVLTVLWKGNEPGYGLLTSICTPRGKHTYSYMNMCTIFTSKYNKAQTTVCVTLMLIHCDHMQVLVRFHGFPLQMSAE